MRLWYGMLIRCLPAEFRAEFGDEMLNVMRQQRSVLPNAGWLQLARFHLFATADLLRAVGLQRRALVKRLASVVLFLAAAANIAYDLANPKLDMGVLAWLVTIAAISWSLLLSRAARRPRRLG